MKTDTFIKGLRELDKAALKSKLKELREELFWLRFKVRAGVGEGAKASNISKTRRDVARVLTVLNQTKEVKNG